MVGSIFVSDLFVPLDQGGCTQRKPSRNEADARKCSIFVRSYRITSHRAVEMAVRPCGTAGSEPVSDRSCRLKRSMQHLVVHWFGNASARIVCLAVRDQNLTNPYVSSQLACKKIEPICQAIPHLQAETRMRAPIPGEGEFTWQPKNSSRRKSFKPPSPQIQCYRERLRRRQRQSVAHDRDLVTQAGDPAAPACVPQKWKRRASTKKVCARAPGA
jgi:hypothetical protein